MKKIEMTEKRKMEEKYCKKCGHELYWADCHNCDDNGYSHHDCGEDTCICTDKRNNVTCNCCNGTGSWLACPICQPKVFDN